MDKKSFLKAGHTPTLLAAFLYFDLAFMVWVLLGPLGVQIAKDLGLSAAQKGLMVATPLLAGALLRIVMGVLVDQLKPKLAGAIGQVVVMAALCVAWQFGIHSFEQVLLLGVFLGVAGSSFAVALASYAMDTVAPEIGVPRSPRTTYPWMLPRMRGALPK